MELPKLNKKIRVVLQFTLFFLFIWIFYDKFSNFNWSDLNQVELKSTFLLFTGIILMPLNWGLEALKLKANAHQIDEGENFHYKSVLAGVFTGVLTPNRLGNFLGNRLWYNNKESFTGLCLYANLSQFVATCVLGGVALIVLNNSPFNLPLTIWFVLIFIAIAIYFLLPSINLKGITWMLKYKLKIRVNHQLNLLFLSFARSVVIAVQYTCFLLAFNDGQFIHFFNWTLVYYLCLTLIPGWFLNRLVIRESLALFIFLPLLENSVAILLSSLLLWLLNIGLPAMFGAYFTFRKKANVST